MLIYTGLPHGVMAPPANSPFTMEHDTPIGSRGPELNYVDAMPQWHSMGLEWMICFSAQHDCPDLGAPCYERTASG
jgi:hypothetical protein